MLNLTYYLETQQAPGPLYGSYSFPTPTIFAKLALGGFSSDEWTKTRQRVFRPFTDSGYLGNEWATLLRDLYVDFGQWGTLVFLACLGGFMAWARNRFEDTGEATFHALETYAALTLAFGAFQSLLYPDYVATAFFAALAIAATRHLMTSRESRRPRLRATHGAPPEGSSVAVRAV
jgi:hypothetical protein